MVKEVGVAPERRMRSGAGLRRYDYLWLRKIGHTKRHIEGGRRGTRMGKWERSTSQSLGEKTGHKVFTAEKVRRTKVTELTVARELMKRAVSKTQMKRHLKSTLEDVKYFPGPGRADDPL